MKLKGDEQLVALVRSGNSGAFDTIVDRYRPRLLGFCRQMLGSTEDAEDVLQEVLVNAHKAMLADNREIKLKPWLYRIARNRSLNHLRKPKAEAKESMDSVPMAEEASTAAKVHNREEFRQLLGDVTKLPETQRAALMLREIEGLSYEEIAETMETSIPSVKSLLVRARISLAEASQARSLTCGEVKVELAEAAEGLVKVSGPVRRHIKDCDGCAAFRKQLRSDSKTLAMLVPVGPLIALKMGLLSKLGLGGGGATAGSSLGAGAAGTAGTATGAATAAVAAAGSGGAASGLGAVGSAVGLKAVAGVATAAVITAGAVEMRKSFTSDRATAPTGPTVVAKPKKSSPGPITIEATSGPVTVAAVVAPEPAPVDPPPAATLPPTPSTPPSGTGTGTPPAGLEGSVVEVPAEPTPPEILEPAPPEVLEPAPPPAPPVEAGTPPEPAPASPPVSG
jgi:RNA polymerase sigma factor (sigma-70 family)